MIKFKHDDTETLSVVSRDCRIFRAWETGQIPAEIAAERIRLNNDLKELSVDEFIRSARDLGYRREIG